MIKICRHCQKVIGATPPYDQTGNIPSICDECLDPDLRKEKRNQDK